MKKIMISLCLVISVLCLSFTVFAQPNKTPDSGQAVPSGVADFANDFLQIYFADRVSENPSFWGISGNFDPTKLSVAHNFLKEYAIDFSKVPSYAGDSINDLALDNNTWLGFINYKNDPYFAIEIVKDGAGYSLGRVGAIASIFNLADSSYKKLANGKNISSTYNLFLSNNVYFFATADGTEVLPVPFNQDNYNENIKHNYKLNYNKLTDAKVFIGGLKNYIKNATYESIIDYINND